HLVDEPFDLHPVVVHLEFQFNCGLAVRVHPDNFVGHSSVVVDVAFDLLKSDPESSFDVGQPVVRSTGIPEVRVRGFVKHLVDGFGESFRVLRLHVFEAHGPARLFPNLCRIVNRRPLRKPRGRFTPNLYHPFQEVPVRALPNHVVLTDRPMLRRVVPLKVVYVDQCFLLRTLRLLAPPHSISCSRAVRGLGTSAKPHRFPEQRFRTSWNRHQWWPDHSTSNSDYRGSLLPACTQRRRVARSPTGRY